MRCTIFLLATSLLMLGCRATQYVAYEPTDGANTDLHLRVTLTNGSATEIRHAVVNNEAITGTAKGGRPYSVSMDQVQTIEQANGSAYDSGATSAAAVFLMLPFFLVLIAISASGGHYGWP